LDVLAVLLVVSFEALLVDGFNTSSEAEVAVFSSTPEAAAA
jgi:hypothetical protein